MTTKNESCRLWRITCGVLKPVRESCTSTFDPKPHSGARNGLWYWATRLGANPEELARVSLGVLVIVALLAIPAYLTGERAEEIIEDLPGVSDATIEEHEDAATFAFAGVLAVGALALGRLVVHWRAKPAPNWIVIVVLVLSVIVFAMTIRTADLAGRYAIRSSVQTFAPSPEEMRVEG
jgi:small-conductance mechanosensitive channel